MNNILPLLRQLDELYHAGDLEAYEQRWQEATHQIKKLLPGFTLAYAEIYTAGCSRAADGRMTHVLLPTKERKPD